MKLISTLNFKGGVGKTTITWLLARYLVERKGETVLVMDADPQMSLTTAVQLLESGYYDVRFENWYREANTRGATLSRLLREYGQSGNMSIDESHFYVHRPNMYLLPSDEEVYWYDLEAPKAQGLSGFIASLVHWIDDSGGLPDGSGGHRKVDYCFADCPPAFNSLSFSVVAHSDLVLIPVNPDVFASRGVTIMLSGLKKRMSPLPPFLVFMNRARARVDKMTGQPKLAKESSSFLNQVRTQAVNPQKGAGIPIALLEDVYIPERKGIKDALAARQRIPPDLETYFASLWDKVEDLYLGVESAALTTSTRARESMPGAQAFPANELKQKYEQLEMQYWKKGIEAVDEFLQGRTSAQLDEFVRANELPIATKASKEAVREALVSILAQGKAIRGDK